MNQFKGTPGEWVAHGPVITADGLRIAQTHFGDHGDEDARLIAAAPDLLAALMAVKQFGSHSETDDGISTDYLVEKAIQKALGTPAEGAK